MHNGTMKKLQQEHLTGVLLYSVCIAYVFLMWPALSGPFLFDDFNNLEHLNLLANSPWHNLGDYLAAFEGNPGRPLAALSFLINDSAWPSSPFGFKLTNVLFHLLNGVLLFGLLRQLAKANTQLPQSPFWPLLAMAAWLFQPLQISTQMLVVQRMTILATTFCFAGLWAFIALLQRSKNWRDGFAALSVLGFATLLALLCKESGALLPLYATVLLFTLLQNTFDQKDLLSRRLLLAGCVLPALAVVLAVFQMGLQAHAFDHREFTLPERIYTQLHVVLDYIKEILLPSLTGSGIYHDDFPIYSSLLDPFSTLLIALSFITLLGLALWKRAQYPLFSFAVLWYFAGHLMESTVLPLELYFEHRNYLPMLGPALALTAWPFSLQGRKKLGFFFIGIWLAAGVAITALQAPIWGQPAKMVAFWSIEHPKSVRANIELAKFYFDTADPQAAVDVLMHAYVEEKLSSSDLPLTALLTNCWFKDVRYKDANLFAVSMQSIATSPFSNGSLAVLQKLNDEVQKKNCNEVVSRDQWWQLSDALLANPKFKLVAEDFIRIERAKLTLSERNFEPSMQEMEAAYQAHPTMALTYKMAESLISAGLLPEAQAWLEKGLLLRKPWLKEYLSSERERSIKLLALVKQARQQNSAPKML